MLPTSTLKFLAYLGFGPLFAVLGAPARAEPPKILTSLADGVRISQQSGKPPFVMAGQDWCPFTRVVRDDYIAKNAAIQAALAGYVAVELTGPAAKHLAGEMRTVGYRFHVRI